MEAEAPHPLRYHSLDAVRAVAMLLGLWLHAAIPYAGVDELPWAVRDGEGSRGLLLTIVAIHAFRMQVFFMMAGFFAHLLVARRGRRPFIRNRLIRVAAPFGVAWAFMLPVLTVLWVVGWSLTPPPEEQVAAAAAAGILCFPTFHLWFLQYLLLMYVGMLVLLPLGRALRAGRLLPLLRPLMVSPLRAVWLAVPTMGLLWLIPGWNPGPLEACIVPEPFPLLYYGLFFAYGWIHYAFRDDLNRLGRGWIVQTLLGLVVLVPAVCLFAIASLEDPTRLEDTGFQLLAHAAHALLTCLLMFGFLGGFVALMPQPSRAMRYVSDSSYWLYLIHLPLQIAMSLVLLAVPAPGLVKFLIVLVVTTSLMLATYHWPVRSTFVGRVLNGPRQRPTTSAPD